MERVCEICGINESQKRIKFNSSANMYLCNKHNMQYRQYGKFLDYNQQSKRDKNRYKIVGDYTEVYCDDSLGNISATFIIDTDDLDIIKNHKWRKVIKRNKEYIVTGNNKTYPVTYLSRMILRYDGNLEVDHIDGNSLNNRKNNLRIVNRMIQTMNLAPRSDNKFGIRGIGYDKRSQKYTVNFSFNKQRIYIKPFEEFSDAVYARYLLETKLNKYRYTGNDNLFLKYINQLSNVRKEEIDQYISEKINKVTS